MSTTLAFGFQSALRAYMTNCLAGSSCPFTGTVDHALASLGDLLAQVDKTPITNADGRKLGADSLVTGIVAALYSKDSRPVLSSALAAVKSGSAAQACRLVDFYYNRSSNGVYQDNSTEAFEAYNCMDYPQVTSQALKDASKAEIAAKAPTIAPYWSGPDPCAVWPLTATGVHSNIHQRPPSLRVDSREWVVGAGGSGTTSRRPSPAIRLTVLQTALLDPVVSDDQCRPTCQN